MRTGHESARRPRIGPRARGLRLTELPWGMLAAALLLTVFGLLAVISATNDPLSPTLLGAQGRQQLIWAAIAIATAMAAAFLPLNAWRSLAWPCYLAALAVAAFMLLAKGTTLVPVTKGQANWIVLGSLRVQPVEFIKLASLLAGARLLTTVGYDVRKLWHVALALAVMGAPAALLAGEDLGSALCFPAVAVGMLLAAGMRLRHLALLSTVMLTVIALGIMLIPRDGYQWKRIQAWLNPDEYALSEAYQTVRATSAIGSGRWVGKGYMDGDQNRLGWVPEKHTDLILSVIGEELGFVGTLGLVALFTAFGWACLYHAAQCRDPTARLILAGLACLITGQAAINLAVATGLMPVTGVTLPFISYGGSSLLACWLMVGVGCGVHRNR